MKDNSELRALSLEQLNDELIELRKVQFKLRMNKASGLLDNKTHPFKETKKAIARVKTIMTEKVGKANVEK